MTSIRVIAVSFLYGGIAGSLATVAMAVYMLSRKKNKLIVDDSLTKELGGTQSDSIFESSNVLIEESRRVLETTIKRLEDLQSGNDDALISSAHAEERYCSL